ncbi:YceI family protein [Flavihumibacter rivuli]|uniref:YceI family protein n=1 Tax=Flavihumibacter rivuli TaxID=2838156 RepID=UPI001BDE4C71|nr:YceI family protein [Flavihumibacter rivuli]ULQ55128.1 YceI family protein [Flavihumibacter rivuli]
MKKLLLGITCLLSLTVVFAQTRYFTKTGHVSFYSKTPMENIEAQHRSATCVVDVGTGAIQMAVLMKGFSFEKALMQEHFHENYVESDKYPKSEFRGVIENISSVQFTKDGSYPVTVKGKLTLHGVTKDIATNGVMVVKNGKPSASAEFNIALSDYNIAIPSVVKEKISNTIAIKVDCDLEPLKQ